LCRCLGRGAEWLDGWIDVRVEKKHQKSMRQSNATFLLSCWCRGYFDSLRETLDTVFLSYLAPQLQQHSNDASQPFPCRSNHSRHSHVSSYLTDKSTLSSQTAVATSYWSLCCMPGDDLPTDFNFLKLINQSINQLIGKYDAKQTLHIGGGQFAKNDADAKSPAIM
jgi:hypothetical protein